MGLEIIGIEEMNKRIFNLQRALPGEIKDVLIAEAEIDLEEMKRRTPVKTGALQSSGEIGDVVVVGHVISVPITFGTDLTYGIFVHEDLEANHPNGGQAKFVESVILESEFTMLRRLQERINLNRLI